MLYIYIYFSIELNGIKFFSSLHMVFKNRSTLGLLTNYYNVSLKCPVNYMIIIRVTLLAKHFGKWCCQWLEWLTLTQINCHWTWLWVLDHCKSICCNYISISCCITWAYLCLIILAYNLHSMKKCSWGIQWKYW